MNFLVFFLILFLAACTNVKQTIEHRNHEKLEGAWSWYPEKCSAPTALISFSEDGKEMYSDNVKGLYIGDGIPRKRVIYSITSESENILVTSIQGEGRKNSSGSLVGWSLVIQSESRFCWRRSDWNTDQCTKSLTKCD